MAVSAHMAASEAGYYTGSLDFHLKSGGDRPLLDQGNKIKSQILSHLLFSSSAFPIHYSQK